VYSLPLCRSGSVITIVIPPKKQVSEVTNMLLAESGKASNIKDRTNRNSVVDAQTSARERLKLYTRTPNNGLILLCGYIMEENGTTEKKIMIDF
jgi:peptide chain release factor subunit 1